MIKRTVGTVLALLTLGACGQPAPAAPSPPTPAVSSDPAQAAPGAPAPSATLKDCGTVTLSHGDDLSAPAARCLIQATGSGLPARLRVTSPTVEGDPIPVTYTVTAVDQVEVITDTRRDGFGEKSITRRICASPSFRAGGLDFTRCTEPTPLPG